MNCPNCGFDVSAHTDYGFQACELTGAQAMIFAQRHAAAIELWRLDRLVWRMCDDGNERSAIVQQSFLTQTQKLIRLLGIQRPLRSETQ